MGGRWQSWGISTLNSARNSEPCLYLLDNTVWCSLFEVPLQCIWKWNKALPWLSWICWQHVPHLQEGLPHPTSQFLGWYFSIGNMSSGFSSFGCFFSHMDKQIKTTWMKDMDEVLYMPTILCVYANYLFYFSFRWLGVNVAGKGMWFLLFFCSLFWGWL